MAEAKTAQGPAAQRPLSPHLSIYNPLINMVMSIVHRLTGVALYFGTLLLAWWLIAAATGPEAFSTVSRFFNSWIGTIILFGYTWALLHHLAGGVRHFIWDTGRGFDLATVDRMAWGTGIFSAFATLAIWWAGIILN